LPGALRRSKSQIVTALGLTLLVACKAPSTRPAVSAIDLGESGDGQAVDHSAVLDGLASYDEYDPSVLGRDLERVERYYRARGYYEAKVTAARVLGVDPQHVRIELRVEPGKQVVVGQITSEGLNGLPLRVATEVLSALGQLRPGAPFDEAKFDDVKAAVLEALQDRGFPFAKVDARAHVDLVKHQADIAMRVEPGVLASYGEVTIEGLSAIPERPVRDILGIQKDKRYSRRKLAEARQAVLKLGVFSNVEVREDLSHPERSQVPIAVVVRETELRTVRLGGGATFDVLRLNLHLRIGWEHLNFLGGARDLSLTATPGVDLYPTRLDGATPLPPSRALLENSIQMKFKQPSFVEARTVGTVDARYDIKPLLYPLNGSNPKLERIVGYQTVSTEVGVERDFFLPRVGKVRGHLTVAASYNWQANFPFIYQGDKLPAGLARVTVAFPALVTTIEYRDDPIQTHAGVSLTNSLQVADKVFGGSVSDVRIQPDFRVYIPITKKSVTLATRLTLGFLFPRDYGDTLNPRTAQGQQGTLDPLSSNVVFDQEKLLLRAFYSGGSNSNRGYPLRGVGPHGPVGFLVPTGANCSLENTTVETLNAACIRPLGGFTLWETSLELRFPISGSVSGVVFADASDVTRDVGHVRFNVPHLSVGPGLRYMTPVGPLRLDIGYRVPGAQALGHSNLSSEEGGGDTGTLFGRSWLPMAINIAIGEAF
jgi:outer membrane protein assembly factor BamA